MKGQPHFGGGDTELDTQIHYCKVNVADIHHAKQFSKNKRKTAVQQKIHIDVSKSLGQLQRTVFPFQ
jgi:hypothetical protein